MLGAIDVLLEARQHGVLHLSRAAKLALALCFFDLFLGGLELLFLVRDAIEQLLFLLPLALERGQLLALGAEALIKAAAIGLRVAAALIGSISMLMTRRSS